MSDTAALIDPHPPPKRFARPTLPCEICGHPFQITHYGNANRFCSRRCANIWKRHPPDFIQWLAGLWRTGLSTTKMARQATERLNRPVTRNVIAGIADRNREAFPERPAPLNMRSPPGNPS